jgi:hypothetical protein
VTLNATKYNTSILTTLIKELALKTNIKIQFNPLFIYGLSQQPTGRRSHRHHYTATDSSNKGYLS